MLEGMLVEEMVDEEMETREGYMDMDPLQYLRYTFLTIHRYLSMHIPSSVERRIIVAAVE